MVDCRLMLNFNGSDAATTTDDATGRHNSITFNGTAQLDTSVKRFGVSSLELDGDSDFMTIPYHTDFDICADNTETWTVEGWFKHTDHAGDEMYIEQRTDANNLYQLYHSHGNGLRFRLYSDATFVIDTGYGGEITDTRWHHIALCKVADEYGIYKDGKQVCYVQDSSEVTLAGPLYIGATGAPASFFDGHIDNVAIWKGNPYNAAPNSGKTDTIDILNPVAHYTLDDDAASTTVLDSSGNNFTANLEGGNDTEDIDVTGQVDGALDLDGSLDYVDINQTFTDIFTGSFSISILVKPDDGQPGTAEYLWGSNESDTDQIYLRLQTVGKLLFYYESNNIATAAEAASVNFANGAASEFTHIVCVADSTVGGVGGLKIYVNGLEITLDGTNDGDTSGITFGDFSSAVDMVIGAVNGGGGASSHFDGKIDDWILFNKALTAAEVLAIYNATQDGESGVAEEYDSYDILPTFPEYPEISRGVNITPFTFQPAEEAIRRSSYSDGTPLVSKRFTFIPQDISFTMSRLTNADRTVMMEFFDEHGGEDMAVKNPSDELYHHVVMSGVPTCSQEDDKDYWSMEFSFREVSNTTWS